MNGKKFGRRGLIALLTVFCLTATTLLGGAGVFASAKITKRQINSYFHQSAFIGSSLGVGQSMYFRSKGKNFLGHPKMLVYGCYSLKNDDGGKYQIRYNGYKGKARYVIKKAKVKRVFIQFGANDMWESPEKAYKRYKRFLKGVRKTNPKVTIFIEASTPMTNSSQLRTLNNKNLNKLNQYMEKYCKSQKNMYFIDIATPMKNKKGGMRGEYSSDNYVHVNMKGYAVWTNTVVKYVRNLLKSEKEAKSAVAKYQKNGSKKAYKKAKKAVYSLEKSDLRSSLIKKLKASRAKYEKIRKAKEKKAREEAEKKAAEEAARQKQEEAQKDQPAAEAPETSAASGAPVASETSEAQPQQPAV